MKTPILGQSYTLRSPNAAADRMVNLFPELIPTGGKEAAWLQRTPGLNTVVLSVGVPWNPLLTYLGVGPVRGMRVVNGVLYVVAGGKFFSYDANYTETFLGSIAPGTTPVVMADNGVQIFIACNPEGFIYNINTGAFGKITDPDFPGASSVGYLDGYFVFTEPNSQKVWVTSLLDGTSIDATDFASAEGNPDNIVGMIIDHREVWLFGENSTEVWYNSGAGAFPLERIQGAFLEIGCESRYSIAKADNSVFWLGSDQRGHGIVYRANGYSPVRISTHAVEYAIQGYADISDAIAYTYQQEGHYFYVLNFPSANTTWVYDAATNAWHERGYWNRTLGEFGRHRGQCVAMFNGAVHVGDYLEGTIYTFDFSVFSDGGYNQPVLRRWRALPQGAFSGKRMMHHSLVVHIESGVGESDPVLESDGDPQAMLRWSDDGGHTWGNWHYASMGKFGEFGKRLIWRRLGMTNKLRDRVYEMKVTAGVQVAIMGAELEATVART